MEHNKDGKKDKPTKPTFFFHLDKEEGMQL